MAKRTRSPGHVEDQGLGADAAEALDAARREMDGLGKAARRQFGRLERRIEAAVKNELKRRRQLDEARTEVASLLERVAEFVRPAPAPTPTEGTVVAEAVSPKSRAPRTTARASAPATKSGGSVKARAATNAGSTGTSRVGHATSRAGTSRATRVSRAGAGRSSPGAGGSGRRSSLRPPGDDAGNSGS